MSFPKLREEKMSNNALQHRDNKNDHISAYKKYYIGCGKVIEFPADDNVFLPSAAGIFFWETLFDRKLSHRDFENKKILDLGCGSGFMTIAMALHRFKYITASDINPYHVEYAREQFKKYFPYNSDVSFIHSDLFNDMSDAHFDLIAFNCPGWATPTNYYIHTLRNISDSQYYSMFEGDKIAIRCISESLEHLSKHGSIIIGLNSISNIKGVLNSIRNQYGGITIKILSKAEFPLLLYNRMWQENKDILLAQLDNWYEAGISFFRKEQEDIIWTYEVIEISRRDAPL